MTILKYQSIDKIINENKSEELKPLIDGKEKEEQTSISFEI